MPSSNSLVHSLVHSQGEENKYLLMGSFLYNEMGA